jgi:hypothetical protein
MSLNSWIAPYLHAVLHGLQGISWKHSIITTGPFASLSFGGILVSRSSVVGIPFCNSIIFPP